jgi:hypothetical protein
MSASQTTRYTNHTKEYKEAQAGSFRVIRVFRGLKLCLNPLGLFHFAPVISLTLPKKVRLRSLLKPQFTGGDW